MLYRVAIIALFFTGAFAVSQTASAQIASLQGNIIGTDGRPLQGAEVRIEGKDKPGAPITAITGGNGQYLFAGLPPGVYKMSIVAGGAMRFSANIRMRGEKARIDLDLSPSAAKKIRNYVWVPGRTGSNLPGRWAERDVGIARPNR